MQSRVARVALVSMRPPSEIEGLDELFGSTAAELAGRGVSVELLTRAESEPRVREIAENIVLHELAAGPSGPVPPGDLLWLTDAFGEAVAGLAGRAGVPYDVMHAFGWQSGLACLPVALELGVPLVQSFLPVVDGLTDSAPVPRGELFLANQASAIVAASAAEATAVIERRQAPADRVWIVPPGVDTGFFRPHRSGDADVRERLSIGPDRPVITLIGRDSMADDGELAVRSLAELHALRGWSPVLVIVDGGVEHARAERGRAERVAGLRDLAGRLGVAGDVRFSGPLPREHRADLLALASVTLMPTRSDAVDGESAASGTPVVGSSAASLAGQSYPESVVDSRDPTDWARAIAALLERDGNPGGASAAARRRAEAATWATTATALLGVYASLGGRPGVS